MENQVNEVQYNDAKPWQIGFFALNNTATNLYLFLFMFISYYATGVAGLLVVVVSTVITFSRVWDGFTDPIIGFLIDRTETKLGKFRPFMIIGNIMLATLSGLMIFTTHLLPEGFRLIYFIVLYGIYIFGYTFQTACTKAAQTVLTNNPKRRPMFTLFDGIFNTGLFIGGQMFIASYLVPKHGGFNMGFFTQAWLSVAIISGVFTVLAVIALWNKDVKENWGNATEKIHIREYWPIIKKNRPLQMLIISASTDKLAGLTKTNAVTTVIIFGILMGNYALSGKLMMITAIPTIIITYLGIGFAKKMGIKKAYVGATWLSIILSVALFIYMKAIDMTTISIEPVNVQTIIFLALLSLLGGTVAVGGNIVIPMIADCADYENYVSGKFIPGMLGTIFSFIDKLVSSVSTAIIGFMVAMFGFKEAFPTVDTPYSTELFWMGMFFYLGMPILGWLASLIAMKFYTLDAEKMHEVQMVLAKRKQDNIA